MNPLVGKLQPPPLQNTPEFLPQMPWYAVLEGFEQLNQFIPGNLGVIGLGQSFGKCVEDNLHVHQIERRRRPEKGILRFRGNFDTSANRLDARFPTTPGLGNERQRLPCFGIPKRDR